MPLIQTWQLFVVGSSQNGVSSLLESSEDLVFERIAVSSVGMCSQNSSRDRPIIPISG